MPFRGPTDFKRGTLHKEEKLGFELTLHNSYRLALLASVARKLVLLPSYGFYLQPIAHEIVRRLVTSA